MRKGERDRGVWVTGTFHSLVRNGFQNATFKYYRYTNICERKKNVSQ